MITRTVKVWFVMGGLILVMGTQACTNHENNRNNSAATTSQSTNDTSMSIQQRLDQYTTVKLTADVSKLTENQKKMIPLLIDAAKAMDDIYWQEAYGNEDSLLSELPGQQYVQYAKINYGPWDRLEDNKPFVPGVGPRPAGAHFYPADMTKEEFESSDAKGLKDLYTLVRRDDQGNLYSIPYHEAFAEKTKYAAEKLEEASKLAEDPGLKKYLELRAQALLTDDYQKSDFAWLDMKDNVLDVVIGPIETYEDQLLGYKASHEAYVLIKDQDWSKRLAHYARFLPALQKELPVPEKYKQEKPGTDSDLNAYNVVYYAGDANAGAKTIAINLPNDEQVQLEKGTRRLQLENAMRAKFDKILVPIANELIAPDQRQYVNFNAFFNNTMFHEVAHGLGIKNTINGKGTVREAMKEEASALEEGKADIVGLFLVTKLMGQGEITNANLKQHYVTFLASIFRSVRFGAADAHGIANMLRFYFFEEHGAFTRDEETGMYRVNFDKMKDAMDALSQKILMLQGDGNYETVKEWVDKDGHIGPQLQKDLQRLTKANIPKDVIFDQGVSVLGL
ncbi:MAG TPA: hypothetical protein VKA08_14555 [Balneolales bacterium]|nr:hypothetical protein [Balneolales bacterium]